MNSPNQLSFLPDDYLERKAQRRTNAICATLFLVVLAAIGSAFTYGEKYNRDVDRRYQTKLKEFTAEAKRIGQADMMQEKQRTMAHQAELAASLLEKVPRSFVLAEITNAMPRGVSLMDYTLDSRVHNVVPSLRPGATAFEQRKAADSQKTAAPVEQVKAYDVTMRMTGIAQTDVQVAAFIRKLNQSKLLTDVNLVITDQFEKDGDRLRKFVVECKLDPSAQVQAGDVNSSNKTAAVEVK